MTSVHKQPRSTRDTQRLHAQRASRPRALWLSLVVPSALLIIVSGILVYLVAGSGTHPDAPAAAGGLPASTGTSTSPASRSGRSDVIPPGGQTGSTALAALGSNALPVPEYLQARIKSWRACRGGTAVSVVSGDLGAVTQTGGVRQYVAMKGACEALATVVRTAQTDPRIPDAAMQKLYSAALTDLAYGATECYAAISQKPDGDEYDVTSVDQPELQQAQSEFAAGAKDLYRATAEIEALGRAR